MARGQDRALLPRWPGPWTGHLPSPRAGALPLQDQSLRNGKSQASQDVRSESVFLKKER